MSSADRALLAQLLAARLPRRVCCATCDARWGATDGRSWCLTAASPFYKRQVEPANACPVWAPNSEHHPPPPLVVERRLLREAHAVESLRLAGR